MELSQKQRAAFFLNIYQCMYIHNFLRMAHEGKGIGETEQSVFSRIKSYVLEYSSKPFYYNIGGINFNLDELKHGILRGNKRPPTAYVKTLGWSDQRSQLLKDFIDPRINFVCQDFPAIVEHLDAFNDEKSLNEKLNSFVQETINDKVSIDIVQKEILLPKVLFTYKDDFGGSDEQVLRFVFRYLKQDGIEEDQFIREACHKKSLMIRYD